MQVRCNYISDRILIYKFKRSHREDNAEIRGRLSFSFHFDHRLRQNESQVPMQNGRRTI